MNNGNKEDLNSLANLQKIDLNIAKKFASICDQHGLVYYMLGGTMLGAIRHKGFIPWDDDMDFGLFRDDYERFLKIASTELQAPLKLETYQNTPDYHNYFSRIIDTETAVIEDGIGDEDRVTYASIDIFPIDGSPNLWLFRQIYFLRVLFHRALAYRDFVSHKRKRGFAEKCLIFILQKLPIDKFISTCKELDKIDKIMSKQRVKGSKYVGNIMGAYRTREVTPAVFYGNGAMYPFEDTKFRGPVRYADYLRQLYGDYMKMPSQEEINRKKHYKNADTGMKTNNNLEDALGGGKLNKTKLHEINLDIAKEITSVCDQHGLSYYMLGGTMLGAIRHKGFIPWDDDMDFGMFRDDYEKFLKIAPKELSANMKVVNYRNTPDYQYYWTRVVDTDTKIIEEKIGNENRNTHVTVDVFPLDGSPNNWLLRQVYYFRVMFHRALMSMCHKDSIDWKRKRGIAEKGLIFVLYKLPIEKFTTSHKEMSKIDKIMRGQNVKDSKYIGNLMGAYRTKEMFPSDVYGDGAKYPFENTEFCGVDKYDQYLTRLYGDYMTMPSQKDIDRKIHYKVEELHGENVKGE